MLPVAALLALWALDWYVTGVNFGPVAAIPIFFIAYRVPRTVAYAFAVVCAVGFALADADSRLVMPDAGKIATSALALFAAFAIVVWSSRRFLTFHRSVDALRRALTRREELADTDFVSGIYNRMFFERALLSKLSFTENERFAVVIVDLDGFKTINDRLGHLAGDAVLRSAAERFVAVVAECGIAARIGGDEFALLIDGSCSPTEIVEIENELRRALATPFAHGKEELIVTASFGSSIYPDDGDSRATLLAIADARMYAGKRARRTVSFSGTLP